MGDFSEHVLFGLMAGFVVLAVFNSEVSLESHEFVAAAIAVFIGSVLPDIDNKNAYVHRAVKAFTSIGLGVVTGLVAPFSIEYRLASAVAAMLATYGVVSRMKIRHRGFTHSFNFTVMLTAASSVAGLYILGSAVPGLALGIGLTSHLLLDGEFKFS